MARIFTPAEMARLRRQFFDSISAEALSVLSDEALATSRQAVNDAAAANGRAIAAAEAAQEAHAEATAARFIAQAASTPSEVSSAVAAATSGLANTGYVDQAEADAKAYADGKVAGLATEGYVDGKFTAGLTTDPPIRLITDHLTGAYIDLTFTNGLLTAAVAGP